jgi:hypothetical protein
MDRTLGGPQNHSEHRGKEKIPASVAMILFFWSY